MLSQERSKRTPAGGRYKTSRGKKRAELGGLPALTKLGSRSTNLMRTRGKNYKHRLLHTDKANIYDPKTKKYAVVKIKTIVENPANRHFVRRNIMTKGTVIETDIGKAVIKSRPGQDGTVNAQLL
ncbi:30S ribosomal protein S8e [Candidatus Woesearchaeota archaeon]|nr:30S ribosomal protein S8e [Candidatus Woesearchaeota archaeon]